MVTAVVVDIIPAYIDPGSGSLLFQAAVGAIMAISLTLKVYWRRVKTVFGRTPSTEPQARPTDD